MGVVRKRFETEIASNANISDILRGQQPGNREKFFKLLKEKYDQNIGDVPLWIMPVYRRVFGASSAPIGVIEDAMIDQFYNAARLTGDKLKKFSDQYAGEKGKVYAYARYAMQQNGKRENPILTGVTKIYPYEKGDKFLRSVSEVIHRNKTMQKKPWHYNKLNGFIIPFGDYFFEIGIDKAYQYPFFIGHSQSPNGATSFHGISFRRYPKGRLLAARIFHQLLPNVTSLDNAKESIGYTTLDKFTEMFSMTDANFLENIGNHDGKGPIVSKE